MDYSFQNFPVPANYASKSMLVVGDTLKLVDEGKEKRFKQIEHVKRHKTTGILTKKDGKWKAVTPEGSYKVLPAAVSHFGADVGSEVTLHLPANNLTVPYGAIESVKGAAKESDEPKVEETKPDVTPKAEPKVEKKIEEPLTQVKDVPKEKKEVPKVEARKAEEKKVEPPKPAPKIEVAKVETEKPAPKVEKPVEVKEEKTPAKETVVIKPEPLKAITIEPEPKVEEAPKTVAPEAAVTKPAPLEVAPEEDELT